MEINRRKKEFYDRKNCEKKYLHAGFFPAHSMNVRCLPKNYQDIAIAQCIQYVIKLTGMIEVQIPGGDFSAGTGCVQRIRIKHGACPCGDPRCRPENLRNFAVVTVSTVNHVIQNANYAKHAKFILGYLTKGQKIAKCKTLKVLRLLETDRDVADNMDWCAIECVTHDMEVVGILGRALLNYQAKQEELYERYRHRKPKLVVVIGHPHGGPMKVSFGERGSRTTLKDVRDRQNWCRYEYNALTCVGNSGSQIMILAQPICGFGYWFGHPHNHSEAETTTLGCNSSIGVDHTDEYDFTPSFDYSGEVQESGSAASVSSFKKKCDKKHLHGMFHPAREIDKEKIIPSFYRRGRIGKYIQSLILLTGLIKVTLPDGRVRYGTGLIKSLDQMQNSVPSNNQKIRGKITIVTSNKVITNQADVGYATFIFDYDPTKTAHNDRRTLYGFSLSQSDDPNVSSVIFAAYTYGVIKDVNNALYSFYNIKPDSETDCETDSETDSETDGEADYSHHVAVIGHSHGGFKKLSFGNADNTKINAPSCPGFGGAPVIIFKDPIEIRLLLQGNKSTTGALCSQAEIHIQ